MSIRLEHANMHVRDINTIARFLKTAFPDFRIRQENNVSGPRWMHIGTDDTYITLNEAADNSPNGREPYSEMPGINHLGYEVDNVIALRRRMLDAGYEDSTYPNKHPHRTRVYFYDPEGNDWEFVQYHSEDAAERNDYKLADQ